MLNAKQMMQLVVFRMGSARSIEVLERASTWPKSGRAADSTILAQCELLVLDARGSYFKHISNDRNVIFICVMSHQIS